MQNIAKSLSLYYLTIFIHLVAASFFPATSVAFTKKPHNVVAKTEEAKSQFKDQKWHERKIG